VSSAILDELLAGHVYERRYRCAPERECLRQEVYRWARRRGVRVSTLSDGGGRGWLHAVVVIAGQCFEERRAVPRPRIPKESDYRAMSKRDELADLTAVAQLHSIVRGELRAAGLSRRSA
jgi:hypothetical protein